MPNNLFTGPNGVNQFLKSTTIPNTISKSGLNNIVKPFKNLVTPSVVTSDIARKQVVKDTQQLDSILNAPVPGQFGPGPVPASTPIPTSVPAPVQSTVFDGPYLPTGIVDNKVAVATATQNEVQAKVAVDQATQAKQDASATATPQETAMAETKILLAKKQAELATLTSKVLEQGGVTMNDATANKLFGKDMSGVRPLGNGMFIADKKAMDRIGGSSSVTPTSVDTTVKSAAQTAAEQGIKDTQNSLDALQVKVDARSASLIEGIKTEYANLIQQQKSFNDAYQGGITTIGIRSGRSRYAGEIQMGIMKNAVDQGVSKISDLQMKKNVLIMQAQQAKDKGDFRALASKMASYRDIIRNERKATQQSFVNILRLGQETRAVMANDRANARAALDSAVVTLRTVGPALADMANSITDPTRLSDFIDNTASNMGISSIMLKGEIAKINNKQNAVSQNTVLDFIKKYPDAGISATDTIQVAQQKVQQSPSFQRGVQIDNNRINKGLSGGTPTAADKQSSAVAKFAKIFVPGVKSRGVDIIEINGFANPAVWRSAAANAPKQGLTRKRFIQEFGYLVDTTNSSVEKKYGLTNAELKSIVVNL